MNYKAASDIQYEDRIGKAGIAVKEGIISSLQGINEIEAEIVSLVRNTVSNTLRAGEKSENIGAYSAASSTWFNGFPPAKVLHLNQ